MRRIAFSHVGTYIPERIKSEFNHQLKIGDSLEISVPHRDLYPKEKQVYYSIENGETKGPFPCECNFLPDRFELPNTFSFRHIITDTLNAICPQAPDNFEELPEDVQKSLANESEGQGMWKFIKLKIEENDIIAVVKKL